MDTDDFSDLVQQAHQLTADMDSGLELPKVERNLRQISEMASRMASKGPMLGQDTASIKA
jgi:nuclear pore complex protein Nup93